LGKSAPGASPENTPAEAGAAGLTAEDALAAEEERAGEKPELTLVSPAPPLPEEEKPLAEETAPEPEAAPEPAPKKSWLRRLKEKLSATAQRITAPLEAIVARTRTIDDEVLGELEEILYTSDLGVPTTEELLKLVKLKVERKELKDVEALKIAIRDSLVEMMDIPQKDLVPESAPRVLLALGVNGVGKTTTIAKLTRNFQERGQKVLLAAGDTFRAAAVDQLRVWAERLGVDCVAQASGADPAAVVFDALNAAKARKSDVVIIDTAGRLHTKQNLMQELIKIKKVAGKAVAGSPHETILVLDAHTGQNAVLQAQTFHEAVGVDSIIVTKLDGTSKGGVVVSIIHELKIPVIFIGVGESFEDLRPFDPVAYANAIMGMDAPDAPEES
jgi:fused signal recognition particle receptor